MIAAMIMDTDTLNLPPEPSDPGSITPHLKPVSLQVVCGTDFTKPAMMAAKAAVALASRFHHALLVLHAFDEPSRLLLPKELRDSLRAFEQQQFREEVQRLRQAELPLREAFCEGAPADVLVEFTSQPGTSLVVISSGRHSARTSWIFGSVAEQVTTASLAPTLVVRNAAPLVDWAHGKRKLRVFVAADFSVASDAALRWVRWLSQFGPCDLTVAYIESPLVIDTVLGSGSSPGAAPLIAKIEQTEELCFRRRARKLLSTDRLKVCFEKGWGQSDAHLLQLAKQERADLIVVGTGERQGLSQFAHHSVSRGILRYSPVSVAAIPVGAFSST